MAQVSLEKKSLKVPDGGNYGLSISELKLWSQERLQKKLSQESSKQDIAVAKVRGFLDAIAWRDETRDNKRLKKLIYEFFKICIRRLRLTPQACMAFFNPGEWKKSVSQADMMKIRRLMLAKLFIGWKVEARELKIMRYKASQILSRMVRRTKGPMWVKESLLVCFHMWYRYASVKRAYRLEVPDPRFTNPFLPQWTKLFKEITLSRVKKKRSLEKGHILTQRRAFRKWFFLMSVDRSKPVTPLAVAIMHYRKVLTTKMLKAWFELVRERGHIVRFRNSIFERWKAWAPKNHKLRMFNDKALAWLRVKQLRRSFDVMTSICLNVIGKRTERMKELRRNFCDRRVVLCAYALLGKDDHVLMVDCWRRLVHFWKCRRNWKTFQWHYNFSWHMEKAKVIFGAWKGYVMGIVNNRQSRFSATSTPSKLFKQLSTTSVDTGSFTYESSIMSGDEHSMGSLDDDGSVTSVDGEGNIPSVPSTPSKDTRPKASRMKMNLAGSKRKTHVAKQINYNAVVDGFAPIGHELMKQGLAGNLAIRPNEYQFQLFCIAICLSYSKQRAARGEQVVEDGEEFGERIDFDEQSAPPRTSDSAMAALDPNNTNLASLIPKVKTTAGQAEANVRKVQQKLQSAIVDLDMKLVLEAVSEGAVIDSTHIKQVGLHLGDQYLPLLTLLLTNSVQFIADRVCRGDHNTVLNNIQSPIAAFIVGSQIDRWNKRDLTVRESSELTQNAAIDSMVGGCTKGAHLWRLAVLKLLEVKANDMLSQCVSLPESRSMSDEVAEVLKRKKIDRLLEVRQSLALLCGLPMMTEEEKKAQQDRMPPLVKVPRIKNALPTGTSFKMDLHLSSTHRPRDIYTVLREFTLLTGKLTHESRALRQPLMERDLRLIANGFMKQANADYLVLKRMQMTPEQIAEEEELARKKEQKGKKPKKAKKKKKPKLKRSKSKSKLGRSAGSSRDMSADEDSEEYTASSYDDSDVANFLASEYDNFRIDAIIAATQSDMQRGTDGAVTLPFITAPQGPVAMNLMEESDIYDEQTFKKRMRGYVSNIFLETWIPCYFTEKAHDIRKTIQSRMCKETFYALKRIFSAIQREETIGIVNYLNLRSAYGGLSQWLLDRGIGDPVCRNAKLWFVLPTNWWNFKLVKNRFQKETALTEAHVTKLWQLIGEQEERNDQIDTEITGYQKFLKKTRKEILSIAEKRQAKSNDDAAARQVKVLALKRTEGQIKGMKNRINLYESNLTKAINLVTTGNVMAAVELLPSLKPPEDDQTVATEDDNINFTALVTEYQNEVERLKGVIPTVEAKKAKLEADLKLFDRSCAKTDKLLCDLAVERFNTMVDIQQVVVNNNKQIDATDDAKAEHKKLRKFLGKYMKAMSQFYDSRLLPRGVQLSKEAGARRFTEMMNRPAGGSPGGVGILSRMNTGLSTATSGPKHAIFSDTLTSAAGAVSSALDIPTDWTAEVTGEDDGFILPRPSSPSADSMYSYGTEEEARLLLERQLAQAEAAAKIEEQAKDRLHEGSSAAQKSVEQLEHLDRPLTVDEEIMLLHHNAAENVAKREEELRLLTEKQAQEQATQELRMRVFEDYWGILPRNDDPNRRRSRKSILVAASGAMPMDDEIIDESTLSRTARMWRSVGRQHWRNKEEKVRLLIEYQKAIMSGDFDDLPALNLLKDAVDPLDEELDEMFMMDGDDRTLTSDNFSRSSLLQMKMDRFKALNEPIWQATSENKDILSVSIRDMMAAKAAEEEAAAKDRKNSDASSFQQRRPTRRRAPSTLSVASQKSKDTAGSDAETVNSQDSQRTKQDPFAIVGKQEYLRYKAGMHSRAVNAGEDDGFFSIEFRTGANETIPEEEETATAAVAEEEGAPIGSIALDSFIVADSTPGSIANPANEAIVNALKVAQENAAATAADVFNDDFSDISSMVSQTSSVNQAEHARQVDAYLTLIEQPHVVPATATEATTEEELPKVDLTVTAPEPGARLARSQSTIGGGGSRANTAEKQKRDKMVRFGTIADISTSASPKVEKTKSLSTDSAAEAPKAPPVQKQPSIAQLQKQPSQMGSPKQPQSKTADKEAPSPSHRQTIASASPPKAGTPKTGSPSQKFSRTTLAITPEIVTEDIPVPAVSSASSKTGKLSFNDSMIFSEPAEDEQSEITMENAAELVERDDNSYNAALQTLDQSLVTSVPAPAPVGLDLDEEAIPAGVEVPFEAADDVSALDGVEEARPFRMYEDLKPPAIQQVDVYSPATAKRMTEVPAGLRKVQHDADVARRGGVKRPQHLTIPHALNPYGGNSPYLEMQILGEEISLSERAGLDKKAASGDNIAVPMGGHWELKPASPHRVARHLIERAQSLSPREKDRHALSPSHHHHGSSAHSLSGLSHTHSQSHSTLPGHVVHSTVNLIDPALPEQDPSFLVAGTSMQKGNALLDAVDATHRTSDNHESRLLSRLGLKSEGNDQLVNYEDLVSMVKRENINADKSPKKEQPRVLFFPPDFQLQAPAPVEDHGRRIRVSRGGATRSSVDARSSFADNTRASFDNTPTPSTHRSGDTRASFDQQLASSSQSPMHSDLRQSKEITISPELLAAISKTEQSKPATSLGEGIAAQLKVSFSEPAASSPGAREETGVAGWKIKEEYLRDVQDNIRTYIRSREAVDRASVASPGKLHNTDFALSKSFRDADKMRGTGLASSAFFRSPPTSPTRKLREESLVEVNKAKSKQPIVVGTEGFWVEVLKLRNPQEQEDVSEISVTATESASITAAEVSSTLPEVEGVGLGSPTTGLPCKPLTASSRPSTRGRPRTGGIAMSPEPLLTEEMGFVRPLSPMLRLSTPVLGSAMSEAALLGKREMALEGKALSRAVSRDADVVFYDVKHSVPVDASMEYEPADSADGVSFESIHSGMILKLDDKNSMELGAMVDPVLLGEAEAEPGAVAQTSPSMTIRKMNIQSPPRTPQLEGRMSPPPNLHMSLEAEGSLQKGDSVSIALSGRSVDPSLEHSIASVQIISEIAGGMYDVNSSSFRGNILIPSDSSVNAPYSKSPSNAENMLSPTALPTIAKYPVVAPPTMTPNMTSRTQKTADSGLPVKVRKPVVAINAKAHKKSKSEPAAAGSLDIGDAISVRSMSSMAVAHAGAGLLQALNDDDDDISQLSGHVLRNKHLSGAQKHMTVHEWRRRQQQNEAIANAAHLAKMAPVDDEVALEQLQYRLYSITYSTGTASSVYNHLEGESFKQGGDLLDASPLMVQPVPSHTLADINNKAKTSSESAAVVTEASRKPSVSSVESRYPNSVAAMSDITTLEVAGVRPVPPQTHVPPTVAQVAEMKAKLPPQDLPAEVVAKTALAEHKFFTFENVAGLDEPYDDESDEEAEEKIERELRAMLLEEHAKEALALKQQQILKALGQSSTKPPESAPFVAGSQSSGNVGQMVAGRYRKKKHKMTLTPLFQATHSNENHAGLGEMLTSQPVGVKKRATGRAQHLSATAGAVLTSASNKLIHASASSPLLGLDGRALVSGASKASVIPPFPSAVARSAESPPLANLSAKPTARQGASSRGDALGTAGAGGFLSTVGIANAGNKSAEWFADRRESFGNISVDSSVNSMKHLSASVKVPMKPIVEVKGGSISSGSR